MKFSRSRPARAALLAAAVAFGCVVSTAGAQAQVTRPQAGPGGGLPRICKNIDLQEYFICAWTDFICIGGTGDCHLRLNRVDSNDFAVAVNFRFIAMVGGPDPQVRLGQFVFQEGEASSLVTYHLGVPVRSAEVHLLAAETVIYRERVTITTG